MFFVSDKNFCCVDNYSVLIPYKDLEKLLQAVNKLPQFQARLDRTDEQLLALRVMYTEALQKISELEHFL